MPKRTKPPWCYPRRQMPHKSTLLRWRRLADRLAQAKGAAFACHLCKRPMGRLSDEETPAAWIWLRRPGQWRVPIVKRRLCYNCTVTLKTKIDELEAQGAREHLPQEAGQEPCEE